MKKIGQVHNLKPHRLRKICGVQVQGSDPGSIYFGQIRTARAVNGNGAAASFCISNYAHNSIFPASGEGVANPRGNVQINLEHRFIKIEILQDYGKTAGVRRTSGSSQ